jgi:hypothetical protein
VIHPASEVKWGVFLLTMLFIQVMTKFLQSALSAQNSSQEQTIYRQNIGSIHVHTVIRLYPLLAEVDGGSRPVHVVMINGDEHNVFRE